MPTAIELLRKSVSDIKQIIDAEVKAGNEIKSARDETKKHN